MKLIAEYLDRALSFERLAAAEKGGRLPQASGRASEKALALALAQSSATPPDRRRIEPYRALSAGSIILRVGLRRFTVRRRGLSKWG
jgi:hypothetical protein